MHVKAPEETMEQSSKAASQWKGYLSSCYLNIKTDPHHKDM